jgi:Mn2+/Fe2+ NRAMP family transporter
MRGARIPLLLAVLGPGLMVMLADTDAGSMVTAAQSGATWGYRLLLVQLALVPVLIVVLELSARLAITTGKGFTELIREHFGGAWAAAAVGTLVVTVLGALVTEFAGLAGVGELFGVPPAATVPIAASALVALVVTGGYRRVEVVGLVLGSLELVFVVAAVLAHPHAGAVAGGFVSGQPFGNHSYLALVAANVGAVVMPWMVFYQQSAIVQKGLTARNLRVARLDVVAGAVVTQIVMGAVLVVAAARLHSAGPLRTIGQLATALTPALGGTAGRVILALGIGGAALVASIVVSLAATWAVAEALGKPRDLNRSIRHARLFYAFYAAVVAGGAALVLASGSLVRLAVDVEILNALLLPFVLVFLALLAHRALPRPYRLVRGQRVAFAAAAGPLVAVALLWVGLALGL